MVIALGTGYAAWVAVAGPHHITGPAQPATVLAGESVDPLGLVVPTLDQHFTLGHAALGDSFVAVRDRNWHIVVESPLENGSYIGVPLLIALVIGAIVLRRRRMALFSAAMGSQRPGPVPRPPSARGRAPDGHSAPLHCAHARAAPRQQ